ncbi:hypothetical protein CBER1_09785 [Cercospora berteroae]|uniref:PCI domain-containing protein n=1 Tax=Cercospora berteroae TaxID=357750 RepID=A0A2S6BY60_9PEZI|nr:hypothetical protein CBER1_09785 [Cercospora berteroae]
MDQSRAINALAPFVALAKSANSPRAAADLVQQATSAPNTYVFAELLQQPNIRALADNEQFAPTLTLLQTFAWGTWETYKSTSGLPALSDAQALKLRLLSLLSFAAEKGNASTLNYASLCSRLDLSSTVDLEHLVTQAIYSNLITATLNPAAQTVVITSVAPLRDIAPGSIQTMVSELAAWSGRCDAVLEQLEAEIQKVKADAEKRAKRESKADKQIKAVTEQAEKGGKSDGGIMGSRPGPNTRGANKRDQADEDEDYDDAMDLDDGSRAAGGKKRSGGILGKLTGKGSK